LQVNPKQLRQKTSQIRRVSVGHRWPPAENRPTTGDSVGIDPIRRNVGSISLRRSQIVMGFN
jgi:hypothetical protein